MFAKWGSAHDDAVPSILTKRKVTTSSSELNWVALRRSHPFICASHCFASDPVPPLKGSGALTLMGFKVPPGVLLGERPVGPIGIALAPRELALVVGGGMRGLMFGWSNKENSSSFVAGVCVLYHGRMGLVGAIVTFFPAALVVALGVLSTS